MVCCMCLGLPILPITVNTCLNLCLAAFRAFVKFECSCLSFSFSAFNLSTVHEFSCLSHLASSVCNSNWHAVLHLLQQDLLQLSKRDPFWDVLALVLLAPPLHLLLQTFFAFQFSWEVCTSRRNLQGSFCILRIFF